jgi:hypothetical protein
VLLSQPCTTSCSRIVAERVGRCENRCLQHRRIKTRLLQLFARWNIKVEPGQVTAYPEHLGTRNASKGQVRSHHSSIERTTLAANRRSNNFQTRNPHLQHQNIWSTCIYKPVRSLQSSSKCLLTAKAVDTVLAARGLRHSEVAVWNNLPENIRNSDNINIFKRKLKTKLVNAAFAT